MCTGDRFLIVRYLQPIRKTLFKVVGQLHIIGEGDREEAYVKFVSLCLTHGFGVLTISRETLRLCSGTSRVPCCLLPR